MTHVRGLAASRGSAACSSQVVLSARALFTLVMAPARQLTPLEENAARKAFATLQQKKLIKATTGRGRKPGMAPVHAALAIRAGEYVNYGGGPLSADSQLGLSR